MPPHMKTAETAISGQHGRSDALPPGAGSASLHDLVDVEDPWRLLSTWMAEAESSEPGDPNAMALATSGADGLPDVRMVLLKDFDEHGLVFYTNTGSAKGEELSQNPQAAVALHWKSLRRQVRARGPVSSVTAAEADAYFASRPRLSQIGAVASEQSRPLADRATLVAKVAAQAVYRGVRPVPRPEHWTGFRIVPSAIEFWQDNAFQLPDRVRFTRDGTSWHRTALYP